MARKFAVTETGELTAVGVACRILPLPIAALPLARAFAKGAKWYGLLESKV